MYWDSNQSVHGTSVYGPLTPCLSRDGYRVRTDIQQCQKLITAERNALGDAAIEASEFLKVWWDQDLLARD